MMWDSIVTGEKRMVRRIHKLLNEADAVCHYNGKKFDIPTLNKEFLLHGLPPPSPSKQIDLLAEARSNFRLASNKLDFVAKALGLGQKTKHKGMELWLGCMNGNKEDRKLMEEYNKQDVLLLEKVYKRVQGWIKVHPNLSVMEDVECCTKCGSEDYNARGRAYTTAGSYPRFQCNNCGSWFRGVYREKSFNKTFRQAQ
jgi:hypothetical protein